MSAALHVFRRYVCDFVNRHDFAVLPHIMVEDYALLTAGYEIRGRDGDYRRAVAQQLEQFPGLVYTIHELHVAPGAIAVRFSEHGASNKHRGRAASWCSIAIYRASGDRLVSCSIEQDFFSRRRQLDHGAPVTVPAAAIAPWDGVEQATDLASETTVRAWLQHPDWQTTSALVLDDGIVDERAPQLQQESIEVLDLSSCGDRVAFRALQRGGAAVPGAAMVPGHQYLSGIVTVADGRIVSGHIVRDRLGLQRRLRSG